MNEPENGYSPREAGWIIYLLSVALGCGIAWLVGYQLLELTPLWVMVMAAPLGAMVGCFLGENIVEAIILTGVIATLSAVLLNVGPQAPTVKAALVALACGFCSGKVVHGIWKEIQ